MDWLPVAATVALGIYPGSLLMEGALRVSIGGRSRVTSAAGDMATSAHGSSAIFFPLTNAAVWLSLGPAVPSAFDAFRTGAVVCAGQADLDQHGRSRSPADLVDHRLIGAGWQRGKVTWPFKGSIT